MHISAINIEIIEKFCRESFEIMLKILYTYLFNLKIFLENIRKIKTFLENLINSFICFGFYMAKHKNLLFVSQTYAYFY